MDAAINSGDPPDLDALWDFDRPEESERRFREALQRAPDAAGPWYRAQVQTQVARALGLQRRFDAAHEVLNSLAPLFSGAPPAAPTPDADVARVRWLLERGRVFNSSGRPDRARPLFVDAWELARRVGRDDLAVDAAHMIAIVDPPEQALEWNRRAFELAEASSMPAARRWRASLANNIGWTFHARGQFADALELFERALALRREQERPRDVHVARWCVARCLRSLGRVDEALAAQRELLADPTHDPEPGYTFEEVAECLLALGREQEARPWFARACERLAQDPWLAEREPQRLERLRRLGGA